MFCVFYAYMGCKNEYTLMLIFNKIYYSIAFRLLKNECDVEYCEHC